MKSESIYLNEPPCIPRLISVEYYLLKSESYICWEVSQLADISELKEKLGSAVKKAGEDLKELDVGVAYSKLEDAISAIDIESKKQKIRDFIDSPKMDELKSAGRTVKDFLGFVPNYAQSIPGMIKDGVEKLKNKH